MEGLLLLFNRGMLSGSTGPHALLGVRMQWPMEQKRAHCHRASPPLGEADGTATARTKMNQNMVIIANMLCCRAFAKLFAPIISFNLQNNPVKYNY